MKKYWLIFQLSWNQVLEYRFDFLLHLFKYAFSVIMMNYVWQAVQRSSGTYIYSSEETVIYFILSACLYSLVSFHTGYIEEDIRLGGLTKYLLKPINPFTSYFCFEAASAVLETIIKISIFVPIIWLLGYKLHATTINLLLIMVYLPTIFTFSFNFLSTISAFSFWITQSATIRWAIMIIMRLTSGLLVPISFFPPLAQHILYYLPFEHLAFTPLEIALNRIPFTDALQRFGILVIWTGIAILVRKFIWQAGEKEYEGTGI